MSMRMIIFGLITMLLAACGAGNARAGDPANGKQLFAGAVALADARAPACATCHAITPNGDTGSGQSLSNIGNRASVTAPGQSAEAYLRTAITDPDAHISDGYQDGIMYRNYAQALTAQQVDDLVAYMLTLKSGQDH